MIKHDDVNDLIEQINKEKKIQSDLIRQNRTARTFNEKELLQIKVNLWDGQGEYLDELIELNKKKMEQLELIIDVYERFYPSHQRMYELLKTATDMLTPPFQTYATLTALEFLQGALEHEGDMIKNSMKNAEEPKAEIMKLKAETARLIEERQR